MYIRDEVASITRPLRELKEFKKVFLKKGETKKVILTLEPEALAFYHSDLKFYAEPGEFTIYVGGDSNVSLSTKLTLTK